MNTLQPGQLKVPESRVIPVTSHPPANKIIGLAITYSQTQGAWATFSQKELARETMSEIAFRQGWQFLLRVGMLREVVEGSGVRYCLSESCIHSTKQLLSV